jgi:hypothetical protein
MSSRPYMPFYVGDHVAATSHLSAEEHGALCSLLFAMWRTQDGTLPNDSKALARVAHVHPPRWKRVFAAISDAFIIMDEAQNTTIEQMKMFLTRMGFDSKAVINGDVTQIDLPRGTTSGLIEAKKVLADVPGIAFVHFTEKDVVRHPLVQEVIRAYDRYEAER